MRTEVTRLINLYIRGGVVNIKRLIDYTKYPMLRVIRRRTNMYIPRNWDNYAKLPTLNYLIKSVDREQKIRLR